MARRWNPSLHPRDQRGRFRAKLIGKSLYVGPGGRYTGVKAGAEFRVGRRDVLVKGIVGVAPSRRGPAHAAKAAGAKVPEAKVSLDVNRKRGSAKYTKIDGHVSTVVELRATQAQQKYLERLPQNVLQALVGRLPGPLQKLARAELARRGR